MQSLLPVALLLPLLLVPLALLARRRRGRRTPPLRLLVVAGSGGHTTEILRLLSCLSESYSPRHYVFADSDKMSEAKIHSFEQKRAETFSNSQFTLDRIPRSREVRQSWTSSVVTTLYSLLYSIPLTYRLKPDLVRADCIHIVPVMHVTCSLLVWTRVDLPFQSSKGHQQPWWT
ncbi:UDP-N-acetylglucosamine transferase subunit ALG14 homolog isoform X2 [Accipiter gentilis]|uniref:UDP-N-acetylglucosamine transferase subunit ALG14 homolog isoform X2 n=1 Tax=Astur gentilis TaxID=8957 RepID=UPI002110813F|nr:UDP-N-acetylglucosamine transferase subunit ALG14 homolog isoform X2 [Accipiter gentilis]